jgi:hypothetical protein
MTTADPHDKDRNNTETHDGATQAGHDPRVTSHPTGKKQAAENAENEPTG